jgi:predicted HicB family RNase H-like nuclease
MDWLLQNPAQRAAAKAAQQPKSVNTVLEEYLRQQNQPKR